jgi:hypothetical protein
MQRRLLDRLMLLLSILGLWHSRRVPPTQEAFVRRDERRTAGV